MSPRQRRGLILVGVALLAGAFVVASVLQYTAGVARQLGPRQPVVVVARELPPYQEVSARDLQIQSVPEVFAPRSALRSTEDVAGRVPTVPLPAGTVLQGHDLVDPPVVPEGEREVALDLGVEESLARTLATGDRVDPVLSPSRADEGQPFVLASVPVVDTTAAGEAVVVHVALPAEEASRLARARANGMDMSVNRLPPQEP